MTTALPTLHIVGAGGHAKVVMATALAAGYRLDQLRLVDDNPASHGKQLLGVTVQGTSGAVLADRNAHCVLAIGHNAARAKLASAALCQFPSVVHASAVIAPSVKIGAGTVVFANAVVQPDAILGAHVIVNTGASVDHDCVLGDVVHIAPGVRLAGNVTIGARSFLGIGTVVIPGITIGSDVTVGAGAAVVRNIESNVMAVGVPARAVMKAP